MNFQLTLMHLCSICSYQCDMSMPPTAVARRSYRKKVARCFSDGSGALPRAMMLPRSKSRSVTSSMSLMCLFMAMLALCAGGWTNYEKHHVKATFGNPAEEIAMPNVNTMGFKGDNSNRPDMVYFPCRGNATDDGSRWFQ